MKGKKLVSKVKNKVDKNRFSRPLYRSLEKKRRK